MMNAEDLNKLTEFWLRETNSINGTIDQTIKSAQDHAYALGYRTGREDLIEIRKQRDELLAALKRAEAAMEICSDWVTEIEMPDGWQTVTDEKLKISEAIASVKGGAA